MSKGKSSKPRVTPKSLERALIAIRSRFKAGEVKQMRDIADIYTTGLIAAMGIGYDGYVTKFNAPENFTINDLLKLADITETDFELIWEVAIREAKANYKKRDISHLLGSEDSSDN